MYETTGKVALVTGGASGIGLAITKALLENGLKAVAIIDINEENGKKVLKSIKEQYGDNRVIFIKTDVADRDQFHDAFKTTVETFKNLDIVINNAGVVMEKDWEREIAINLTGTVTGTILAVDNFLPTYKTGNEAVVLNVSSVFGLESCSSFPVYCTTKSGVLGLTRSFGTKLNYERTKVRVMAVCPNFTDTPLIQFNESAFLSTSYVTMSKKDITNIFIQDVSNVSKTMIQMIQNGENGCIWVTEDNQPAYEIEYPNRQQLRKII